MLFLLAFILQLSHVSCRGGLPSGALIAGYATVCDEGVLRAARNGVNLIYWFASSLSFNATTGKPFVSYGGPDLDCIANVSLILRNEGLSTAHLMTVGGWDAPHPDTRAPPGEVYAAWLEWQHSVVSRPGLEGGFDGIDWDLEGNDDVNSTNNFVTTDVLELIGELSAAAHRDNFVVSMVPPESYLDVWTPLFDRSLLHAYNDGWQPNFTYHGRNSYAYLLAKWPSAFDLVLLQLYETFSHLDYAAQALLEPPADYLQTLVPAMGAGWWVDFSSDTALNFSSQRVVVPSAKLLVGFGNAWVQAAPGTPRNATRNTFVSGEEIAVAHKALNDNAPRGYFFWVIGEEGLIPKGSDKPLFFAKELNDFLHVRNPGLSSSSPLMCRDPIAWPFASNSVWNTPLGKLAKFVPAKLFDPDGDENARAFWNFHSDDDYLIVTSAADPVVPWYAQGHWGGPSTPDAYCNVTGKLFKSIHFPSNVTVQMWGNNNAAAILQPDGDALLLMQPLYVCSPGAPVLAESSIGPGNSSLRGDGRLGGHGGSGLNAIGGTIRRGELNVSAAPIAHAVKLELYANLWYYRPGDGNRSNCYFWPASQCDGYMNACAE